MTESPLRTFSRRAGLRMPDPCTEIHPPEEFLDCARGDGGNGNGSAEKLGSVLLVMLTSATLVIVGVLLVR